MTFTGSMTHQPREVHLVVRLTLDLDAYQRLIIYRAQVGADLGEQRDSFDQTSSYLLTHVLIGTYGVVPAPRRSGRMLPYRGDRDE